METQFAHQLLIASGALGLAPDFFQNNGVGEHRRTECGLGPQLSAYLRKGRSSQPVQVLARYGNGPDSWLAWVRALDPDLQDPHRL